MNSPAAVLIGFVMFITGCIASVWNSYLVMQLIGATTSMWVLWVISMTFVILGSAICAVG